MKDQDRDHYDYPEHLDRRHNITNRRHTDFEQCPRYDKHELTEPQITEIAKKAVLLAKDEFYLEVGKSVTTKFFVVVGIVSMVMLGWLNAKGFIK